MSIMSRLSLSFHEAAHVVLAARKGIAVYSVTIEDDGVYRGKTFCDRPRRRKISSCFCWPAGWPRRNSTSLPMKGTAKKTMNSCRQRRASSAQRPPLASAASSRSRARTFELYWADIEKLALVLNAARLALGGEIAALLRIPADRRRGSTAVLSRKKRNRKNEQIHGSPRPPRAKSFTAWSKASTPRGACSWCCGSKASTRA